jgi:hypothetical protein
MIYVIKNGIIDVVLGNNANASSSSKILLYGLK